MFLESQSFQDLYQFKRTYINNEQIVLDTRQLQLISQQSDILFQLCQQIKLKKIRSNSTVATQSEQLPSIKCLIEKQTPSWSITEGQIAKALQEVEQKCTELSFGIIHKICSLKTYGRPSFQKIMEKQIRFTKQLKKNYLNLKMENQTLKTEVQRLQSISTGLDEEKKKIKKQIQSNIQKQKYLLSRQKIILHKEQVEAQMKKKNERYVRYIQDEKQSLNNLRRQIGRAMIKVDTMPCEGNCWRRQLMSICKNSLQEQRQILKKQQQQLKNHVWAVNQIIEELKNGFTNQRKK